MKEVYIVTKQRFQDGATRNVVDRVFLTLESARDYVRSNVGRLGTIQSCEFQMDVSGVESWNGYDIIRKEVGA